MKITPSGAIKTKLTGNTAIIRTNRFETVRM